mmetsp:Transcript_4193/g.13767  ORF Transcript_4193/g.13767 Transcript_4193/m.13767 type:complete len:216 (-) Transcript_4193:1099-1746(-)
MAYCDAKSSTISSLSSPRFMKSSSSSVLKLFLSSSYVVVLPPPVPPPITRCCLALAVSLRHDFHGFRASLLPSLLRDFCIASRCFKNCAAAKPRAPDHPVRYLTLYLSENFAVGTESEYTRLPNLHNKVSSAFSAISRLFADAADSLPPFFANFLFAILQCAETRSLWAHMDLCSFLNICQTSSTSREVPFAHVPTKRSFASNASAPGVKFGWFI